MTKKSPKCLSGRCAHWRQKGNSHPQCDTVEPGGTVGDLIMPPKLMSSFWNLFIYSFIFVQCFLRQTSSTQSSGKGNWRKVFFVLPLGESIPFGWVSWQGFCRTKDDICMCGVLYEYVYVQVWVCADVRAQVWEFDDLKLASLYYCPLCCLRQCLSLSMNQELNIHLDYLASQPALGNLLPPLSPCWDYTHVPGRLYVLGIKFRISILPWSPLLRLNISL